MNDNLKMIFLNKKTSFTSSIIFFKRVIEIKLNEQNILNRRLKNLSRHMNLQ